MQPTPQTTELKQKRKKLPPIQLRDPQRVSISTKDHLSSVALGSVALSNVASSNIEYEYSAASSPLKRGSVTGDKEAKVEQAEQEDKVKDDNSYYDD